MADHTLLPFLCLFEMVLGDFRSRKVFWMFRSWGRINRIFGDMWKLSDDWWLWISLCWNTAIATHCCIVRGNCFVTPGQPAKQNLFFSTWKETFADPICLHMFILCLEQYFPWGWLSLWLVLHSPCVSIKSLSFQSEGFSYVQTCYCSSHAVTSVLMMFSYCVCFLWPL